jgi:hypothetical protein
MCFSQYCYNRKSPLSTLTFEDERHLNNILYKNLVHTSKKIQHFILTKISFLIPFKEVIPCFSEHLKSLNTKCRVTDC